MARRGGQVGPFEHVLDRRHRDVHTRRWDLHAGHGADARRDDPRHQRPGYRYTSLDRYRRDELLGVGRLRKMGIDIRFLRPAGVSEGSGGHEIDLRVRRARSSRGPKEELD